MNLWGVIFELLEHLFELFPSDFLKLVKSIVEFFVKNGSLLLLPLNYVIYLHLDSFFTLPIKPFALLAVKIVNNFFNFCRLRIVLLPDQRLLDETETDRVGGSLVLAPCRLFEIVSDFVHFEDLLLAVALHLANAVLLNLCYLLVPTHTELNEFLLVLLI